MEKLAIVEKICDRLLADLVKRLRRQRVNVTFSEAARRSLSHRGYNPTAGARPLIRLFPVSYTHLTLPTTPYV